MVRWRGRGGADLADIEAVYRRRLAELRRVAAAITGDRDAALDVVQDAFTTAVRQRTAFRGDGTVDAWLWRIVVNEARAATRRPTTVRAHAATDEAAPTNGDSAGGSDVIAASLLTLPERQRLVLFLRYYADLDYATIAAVAGIAPGTVAATLNAAHRALRVRLQEVTR
jgi:RNA polymerase sigma factor (sigma-70 family)